MNICDSIILNLILILFPILLYLIWMAYDYNISKKNNVLLLDMALISSLYLTLHYSNNLLLMFNIPLIIAYVKNRNLAIFLSTMIIIRHYHMSLDLNIYFIVYEYLFYGLLKYIFNDNTRLFVIISLISKCIIYSFYSGIELKTNIGICMIFIMTTIFVLYMLNQVENIMELHNINNKIEHDKQIRTSLFKITALAHS